MDGLLSVRIDESTGLPLEIEDGRPQLQCRSLANALKLCKKKLERLAQERVHTKEDLEHYQFALGQLEADYASLPAPSAEGGKAAGNGSMHLSCRQMLDECKGLLAGMHDSTAELPEQLRPVYARLAELRRRMARMAARVGGHTLAEVVPLQDELDDIDAQRVASGGFGGAAEEEGEASPGQEVCNELLNQCYDLLAECLQSAVDLPPSMQRMYNQLRRIKNALRKMSRKEHPTQEELLHYQSLLEKVDAQQQQQGAAAAEGEEGAGGRLKGHEAAQALLKDCYDLVEGLMESAEGLGEEALAVHRVLEGHRHRLEELAGKPHTYAQLLEVQLALNAIDDDRQAHSGVFAGNTSAGRACSVLLNHCYRVLHDLYGTATAGEAEP